MTIDASLFVTAITGTLVEEDVFLINGGLVVGGWVLVGWLVVSWLVVGWLVGGCW